MTIRPVKNTHPHARLHAAPCVRCCSPLYGTLQPHAYALTACCTSRTTVVGGPISPAEVLETISCSTPQEGVGGGGWGYIHNFYAREYSLRFLLKWSMSPPVLHFMKITPTHPHPPKKEDRTLFCHQRVSPKKQTYQPLSAALRIGVPFAMPSSCLR